MKVTHRHLGLISVDSEVYLCVKPPDSGNLAIWWHGEEEPVGIFQLNHENTDL